MRIARRTRRPGGKQEPDVRCTFNAAEEAGFIARQTGELQREISVTLQAALSVRTQICREKQVTARWNRVNLGTPSATMPMFPPGDAVRTASGSARYVGREILGEESVIGNSAGGQSGRSCSQGAKDQVNQIQNVTSLQGRKRLCFP